MTDTRPATDAPARGPERFTEPSTSEERPSPGRALLAGLALLALLVGVPVLLWLLAGPPPIPTGLPSRDDLTQPVGADLLITVLLAVVWLAWVQFAVCTLVEIVSFVRGGGLPRAVPLSGPSQAVARALVGTLLVGTSFLASTGAASAADLAPATTETGTTAVTSQASGGGADAPTGADQATAPADRHEQGAKPERRMAPVAGVPADMTDVIGHKVAIVQPPQGHYHDNLWDIAERHLGDGRRWKEIYALNQGRIQPDGQQLVQGRLIHPGWVLKMPNDAVGLERVTEMPAEQQHAEAAAGSADSTADAAAETAPASTDLPRSTLARDLTGGGLLGAAVLTALLLERRRRRSAVGPDPDAAEAEVALRVGADLERTAWLDAALRNLSAECRTGQIPLPPVYAAIVADDEVALRIAGEHRRAPEGWRVEDEGRCWVRRREDVLGESRGHAPYPGLVCLGRDDDGRDVLVDLESADGVVSVEGSPAIAREVVAAMAVQLATVPWADRQRIVGHDLGEALAGIGPQTIELAHDLDEALSSLLAHDGQRAADEVLAGRLGRSAGSAPDYLVIGSLPDEAVAERLAGELREGTRGLGVVVAGELRSSRWRASVDDSGRLALPLLDLEVEAVRLGQDSAEAVAELFEAARRPAEPTPTGRPPVPPTPAGAGDDSTWSTARVRVGVLGPLEVRAAGDIDASRLALANELVTFLALQTEPVHPSVLGASVWPMGVTADVRDATIERVRDWLGQDADGNHLLRETEDGRLHLATDVGVDWHAFCQLVRRSREATAREEPELLRRALQLVRGTLLDQVPVRRYSWVARTGLERQATVLVEDAAHRLAELSHDDPPGAGAALRAGLRLVPHSQVLWRDLLAVDSRLSDGAQLPATAEELLVQLRTDRVPLEPETQALLDELLPADDERLA